MNTNSQTVAVSETPVWATMQGTMPEVQPDAPAPKPVAPKPAAVEKEPEEETMEQYAARRQAEWAGKAAPKQEPAPKKEVEEPAADEQEEAAAEPQEGEGEAGGEQTADEHTPRKRTGYQRVKDARDKALVELDKTRSELSKARKDMDELQGNIDRSKRAVEAPDEALKRPVRDDFEDADAYDEALIEWSATRATSAARKRMIEDQEKDAQEKKARIIIQQWENNTARAREELSDFDKVINNDELTITSTMRDVILSSDMGPYLAYYLGKNPGEAKRISGLNEVSAALEMSRIMGRIEASRERETAVEGNGAERKQKSAAPRPLKPLGGSSGGAGITPESETTDGYVSRRLREYRMKR